MYPSARQALIGHTMAVKLKEVTLRDAVLRIIEQSAKGKPAADVVQYIARNNGVNADLVRRELRTLLERGDVIVGPSLNLVVRPRNSAQAG